MKWTRKWKLVGSGGYILDKAVVLMNTLAHNQEQDYVIFLGMVFSKKNIIL